VTDTQESGEKMEGSSNEPQSAGSGQKGLIAMVAVVAIVAIVAGATYLKRHRTPKGFSVNEMRVERMTRNGKAATVAISADGNSIAYVLRNGAEQGVMVRQGGALSDAQLIPPDKVNYGGLAFSPDGNFLYYTASSKDNQLYSALYKMPVQGGAAGWWRPTWSRYAGPACCKNPCLRPNKNMKDVLGQAIADHYYKRSTAMLWVQNQLNLAPASHGRSIKAVRPKEQMPVGTYFRGADDMPELEWVALQHCKGKILDIGAAFGKEFCVGQTVREVSLVQADQGRLRIGIAEPPDNGRSDVTGIARDQYLHVKRVPLVISLSWVSCALLPRRALPRDFGSYG